MDTSDSPEINVLCFKTSVYGDGWALVFFLLSVSTGLSSSIGIIFSVVDLCPYLIFLSLLGPIGAPATLANVILCNHPLGGSLIFIVSIPFSLDASYREAHLSSINMHWYVIPPLANKAN